MGEVLPRNGSLLCAIKVGILARPSLMRRQKLTFPPFLRFSNEIHCSRGNLLERAAYPNPGLRCVIQPKAVNCQGLPRGTNIEAQANALSPKSTRISSDDGRPLPLNPGLLSWCPGLPHDLPPTPLTGVQRCPISLPARPMSGQGLRVHKVDSNNRCNL